MEVAFNPVTILLQLLYPLLTYEKRLLQSHAFHDL
jgi:hypothetical protein